MTFRKGAKEPEPCISASSLPTTAKSQMDVRHPRKQTRLMANSRPAIAGLINNLVSTKSIDRRQRGVPFKMALSNFRRKMILETLKDRSKSH